MPSQMPLLQVKSRYANHANQAAVHAKKALLCGVLACFYSVLVLTDWNHEILQKWWPGYADMFDTYSLRVYIGNSTFAAIPLPRCYSALDDGHGVTMEDLKERLADLSVFCSADMNYVWEDKKVTRQRLGWCINSSLTIDNMQEAEANCEVRAGLHGDFEKIMADWGDKFAVVAHLPVVTTAFVHADSELLWRYCWGPDLVGNKLFEKAADAAAADAAKEEAALSVWLSSLSFLNK
jgi:hypothetical protein